MADPRAFTVRPCPPGYDAKNAAKFGAATSRRRNFFNSVGKIGDIEALNNVGASKVGTGLRTLASISNTIRTGCGALPSSIGGVIGGGLDAGANWVLDNVGIAPQVVEALGRFQPSIANQAFGNARQIFERVEQGNFRVQDIPSYLQDFQNVERLGRNIFTPSRREQIKFTDACDASPYAVDLLLRAPKYKFLFVVEFVYNPGYETLDRLDFAFVVKQSSRPNIRFDMQDVNYYNFHSKLITRTIFEDMKMTFHDDNGTGNIGNDALRFYTAYLRSISPVANYSSWEQTTLFESEGMNHRPEDITGFEFVETDLRANKYSASIGPLANNQKTILQQVNLYHVYDWGRRANVFQFYNPRITQMELDEVNMAEGNSTSEVSLTFAYDSVYVATDIGFESTGIEDKTNRRAIYPMRYVDDAKAAAGPTGSLRPPPAPTPAGANCDPQQKQNTSLPPAAPPASTGSTPILG